MTSEKMNHPMPQRKDMSTCGLYIPLSDSSITCPNQPNIMNMIMAMPTNIGVALQVSCRKLATPTTVSVRPIEPIIGQLVPCGT